LQLIDLDIQQRFAEILAMNATDVRNGEIAVPAFKKRLTPEL